MIIEKPSYYEKFKCIADSCSFTCCREWKIGVDQDTYRKWEKWSLPECGRLCDVVELSEDKDYKIKLNDDKICPLLDDKGLCKVVLKYGEEGISNTCHTFPREELVFENRIEKTLALGCPYVFDLLISHGKWNTIIDIATDGEDSGCDSEIAEYEDYLFEVRDRIITLFEKYDVSIALKMSFYILLNMFDAEEQEQKINDNDFWSAKAIEELYYAILSINCAEVDTIYEQNELLLDIADNYMKKSMYSDILQLIIDKATHYEEIDANEWLNEYQLFQNVWKDIQNIIKLIFQEEIFSTIFMPEGDLYSMVIKMQWLGIFYAILKQSCFLYWSEKNELKYDSIRMITNVLIRMTGYSDADIEEYLENSFEDIIWDFGYFNLII